ncbi:beta subunit of fatty acid synthetase, partial [Coemansia spiralis]
MEFILRTERRFLASSLHQPGGAEPKYADRDVTDARFIVSHETLAELRTADPLTYSAAVEQSYPETATRLLTAEDVQFFIALCKRRGQKPFPFVPVLDADLGVLLLKDSAWQSEDLHTVIGGDPQRVFIQQGPVAAQHSTAADEPAKDILDGIYLGHIASLVERLHGGDESTIPVTEFVGMEPASVALPATVRVDVSESERVFWLPPSASQLPELNAWLHALAGPRKSWLYALVTTPRIAQGTATVENYARRMLQPRPGRRVTVHLADGVPALVEIADSAGALELMARCSADRTICLAIHHQTVHGAVVVLPLTLTYAPSQPLAPIHGCSDEYDDALQTFAVDVWNASADQPAAYTDIIRTDAVIHDELLITEGHSRALCRSVGNRSQQYARPHNGRLGAPAEFLNIATTRVLLGLLQSSAAGTGMHSIVHLYNRVESNDCLTRLHVGDTLSAAMHIESMEVTESGTKLSLAGCIHRDGQQIATMSAGFLARQRYIAASRAFEHRRGETL